MQKKALGYQWYSACLRQNTSQSPAVTFGIVVTCWPDRISEKCPAERWKHEYGVAAHDQVSMRWGGSQKSNTYLVDSPPFYWYRRPNEPHGGKHDKSRL